ncbi:carbon-nitrogen hydrolase family protein [Thalassotalea agarivorans]|uniref:Predicted amidohydrolase n=1 Tax=Thalassotalea agarivorans TaxID=349064 RepID=A0A1I0G0Z6_THASX|nr:carbon-nitrogen hydrolase family protein [Thalassotalea agarivorans]SET63511.1 Predicted amidohydrolase [Thalassotalea agarivorans]
MTVSKNLNSTNSTIRLSAVQLTSVPDIDQNLVAIEATLSQLPTAQQHLVVLPECCLFFGGKDNEQLAVAKQYQIEMTKALAKLAQQFKVYLVAGSIPVLSQEPEKFTNTSYIFSPEGEVLSQYDKIHLFDVEVADSSRHYLESTYTLAGDRVVTTQLPFATIGQTICYDLRFPSLFQMLANMGADVITVPAAFTKLTGQAHWLPLLQARAIENQVYIVAAAQYGTHKNGRETWGQSVIIDPWGEILATCAPTETAISVEITLEKLANIRQKMPVHSHNQFKTELKN